LSINVVLERRNEDKWSCKAKVNNQSIVFKIDTGADANVISFETLKHISQGSGYDIKKTNRKLKSYTGEVIPIKGIVQLTVEYDNHYYVLDTFVAQSQTQAILGKPGIEEMGLMKRVCGITEAVCSNDPKLEANVFKKYPGQIPGTHKITLMESAVPVAQMSRKFPFSIISRLEKELKRLVDLKLIEAVIEPTPWVNQIAIVLKKNGELRLCLDPRQLNKYIIREHYHLPTADEIFNRMHGAKHFSFLDATQGFHHVRLSPESTTLTTFNTPFGRYKWLCMPYGLISASEVFHRRMVELFQDIKGVEIFIDDIAVWGKTKEEHDERLHAVLRRCSEVGIHLNKSKCKFNAKEARYLGHILSKDGVGADPDKIRAIQEMPTPKSKDEVRCMLGMINYLSKFIPDCASKTEQLRILMKKEQHFLWGENQKKALESILNDLSKPPTLAIYDPDQPMVMSVDASQHGLGACLWQQGHPLAYFSCSLTDTQKRYAQIEKEMLAILAGCKRFNQFI